MIKIALDNYPFYFRKKIGPNIFIKRLYHELKKLDCKITSRFNPSYDVGLFAIKDKSIFKKPFVIRIGGIFFDKNNQMFNTKKENEIIFRGINNSNGVIFISEFTKKLTEKFHNNFNKPNIVINNSVPLDKFKSFGNDKRNQLKIKENEFVIIVSGTWRRHKRLEEIIKFFLRLEKKIENLRLLVLGNVSREERLVSNKIIFAGNVNHDELPEWYRAGQLYLHMSWIDQNANTHVEATACGIPSICCNNGGNKEIIQKCNSGIISNVDEEYKFDLVDFYNPPEPNYEILEKDFLKIFHNHKKFKENINVKPISMEEAAKKYLQFLKDTKNQND